MCVCILYLYFLWQYIHDLPIVCEYLVKYFRDRLVILTLYCKQWSLHFRSCLIPLIYLLHITCLLCNRDFLLENRTLGGLYQTMQPQACGSLSIPELMAAGSVRGIPHQENSDDDYD